MLAMSAAALAGCVAVGNREVHQAANTPTPLEIVQARPAAYHLNGAAMGSMKAGIDQRAEPRNYAYAARGVARWARALPAMFPDSTRGVGPTRARPEIWANRADFNARAAAFAEAATQLVAAAQSNDRVAFAAQHQATVATCRGCHDSYQAPLTP